MGCSLIGGPVERGFGREHNGASDVGDAMPPFRHASRPDARRSEFANV
jgi:hypothetical protein